MDMDLGWLARRYLNFTKKFSKFAYFIAKILVPTLVNHYTEQAVTTDKCWYVR
jgi:hypothetical protein